ncbi:hypothetical protein [Flexistipes sp.]|uniref:hypothetical protein n=1 Tax=Flexistipes sp. TaxID=3088135 RepID=UPI002E23BEF5|nr:hypothetical protein [Flexistipes sp.]
MDFIVRLSDDAVKEIKDKFTTYTLSKHLNHDLASRLLKGDANITLKNYIKLCRLMKWDIPRQINIIDKKK